MEKIKKEMRHPKKDNGAKNESHSHHAIVYDVPYQNNPGIAAKKYLATIMLETEEMAGLNKTLNARLYIENLYSAGIVTEVERNNILNILL